jgi:hypothetical protein
LLLSVNWLVIWPYLFPALLAVTLFLRINTKGEANSTTRSDRKSSFVSTQ